MRVTRRAEAILAHHQPQVAAADHRALVDALVHVRIIIIICVCHPMQQFRISLTVFNNNNDTPCIMCNRYVSPGRMWVFGKYPIISVSAQWTNSTAWGGIVSSVSCWDQRTDRHCNRSTCPWGTYSSLRLMSFNYSLNLIELLINAGSNVNQWAN